MSTLLELGTYLVTGGVCIMKPNSGANLWLGSMPDSPDTVAALYEYPGGKPPEYVQESYSPIAEYPQIQAVTRAKDYEDASDFIWQIWTALAAITNSTLSGTKYRSVRPNQSPALLRRDSNDRVLLFFNMTIDKEVNLVAVS